MIKSIIIASVITASGILMSSFYMLYPRAGSYYITEHREKRRSVRPGSHYYYGSHYGTRGFRGGK